MRLLTTPPTLKLLTAFAYAVSGFCQLHTKAVTRIAVS
jgi:hypothetical protein